MIPAGTGSVGVHSDVVASHGVEALAKAARIDLEMDPGVVAHATMDAVNSDRVDGKTGLMREWTRRVKRMRPVDVDASKLGSTIESLTAM